MELSEDALGRRWQQLSPHLNERQRRLRAGAQARALGRGGIAAVARETGMSRSTVQTGAGEIDSGDEVTTRV
ncbi:MAG: ISAzo13 family transposase, partial [Actinomycetota bacterium]